MNPAAASTPSRRVPRWREIAGAATRTGGRIALVGTLAAAGLVGGAAAGPASGTASVEVHRSAATLAPTAAERAERAAVAHLEGQARAYAAAERSQALALALAAVRAADGAAAVLTSLEVSPAHVLAQDAPAAEVPAAEVPAAEVPAAEVPAAEVPAAEVPAAVVPAGEAPAAEVPAAAAPVVPATDALDAARAELERAAALAQVVVRELPRTAPQLDAVEPEASPIEDLAVAEELADGAAEVFALAMQLEVAVQEAAAPQSAVASPVALESAAETAVAQAQVLAPTAPTAAVLDEWVNGAMPLSALCAPDFAPDFLLRCDAAAALELLNAAYRADTGADLGIVSGYRTYEHQVEVKRRHGGLAAAPGKSNHGRGIAVDFADMGGLGQFDAPAYLWMREHAAAFGWYHPRVMQPGGGGPPEPWHWEFGTDSGYDDRDSADRRPPVRPGPRPVADGEVAGERAGTGREDAGEGRPGGSDDDDLKPVPPLTFTPVEVPTFPERPTP